MDPPPKKEDILGTKNGFQNRLEILACLTAKFCRSYLKRWSPQGGPEMAQAGPKMAQDSFKIGPRWFKMDPRLDTIDWLNYHHKENAEYTTTLWKQRFDFDGLETWLFERQTLREGPNTMRQTRFANMKLLVDVLFSVWQFWEGTWTTHRGKYALDKTIEWRSIKQRETMWLPHNKCLGGGHGEGLWRGHLLL